MLTDPSCPEIGGHDPRGILDPSLSWPDLVGTGRLGVETLCARLNHVMREPLLHEGWDDLPDPTVRETMTQVGRWRMPDGDPLGAATMLVMAEGSKSARGAYYTPYSLSLTMALMVDPFPGASVCDPCCGSGGMLLAALEAVRSRHGADAVLDLYGTDIDPRAVRTCKLNLVLAGFSPNPDVGPARVWEANALDLAPAALAEARRSYDEQLELL